MANTLVTRRPLRELRTLYQRIPRTRDVIVEGRTDARLVQWYLEERGFTAIAHAIDDRAEAPGELVIRYGGEIGPRGRVIGFAHEVDRWELIEPTVTCIVDSDRDSLLEARPSAPDCLLRTDFGTMDVYMLQSRPFTQFLRVVLGRDDDADALREKFLPALNEICVVRSVLHWSGLGISLVSDFASCCQFTSDAITVDASELLDRTLKGKDRERLSELMAEIERVRRRIPSERLKAVRGHDMGPLLIRALRLRNVWANEEAFERAWRACLQASDLDEFPMFTRLRERVELK